MKKRFNLILIISTALIVLSLIACYILIEEISKIATIITTITAIIGAVALWIQFSKDKQINQASFIVEFYQTFYSQKENLIVLAELDKKYSNEKYTSLKSIKPEVLNYLGWIRSLCSLIDRGVLNIEAVDEIYGYKFFIILNNKEVQEMELSKYPNLYRLMFRTHKIWSDYRKKKGGHLICESEDLSLIESYTKYCH